MNDEPPSSDGETTEVFPQDAGTGLAPDDALAADDAVTDTTRCRGPCDRPVHEAATVDVVVGARTVGDPTAPVESVRGVDGGAPITEQWCTTCASQRWPITASAHRYRQTARYYVTPKTVAAFVVGVCLMLVVMSVVLV